MTGANVFGARLRTVRRARGLSQAQLGEGRYSGSYISYIESGARQASAEVVAFLCERMGVSPAELGMPDDTPAAPPAAPPAVESTQALEELLLAERAWHDRDFEATTRLAARALASARESGLVDREWQALYLKAQADFAEGRFSKAASGAAELVGHRLSERSPVLRAQALALSAVAYRRDDQTAKALLAATRAVQLVDETTPAVLAEALMALVSVLNEAGASPDEIRAHADRLVAVSELVESEHARGLIAWTLGTIFYGLGESERGMAQHDRAFEQINPQADYRMWLRLQRSMAYCRLDVNELDRVDELLDMARKGLDVVGTHYDRAELKLAEARYLTAVGRGGEAVEALTDFLTKESPEVRRFLAGEAYLFRGDASLALGQAAHAKNDYDKAGEFFESIGAWRNASLAWRRAAGTDVAPRTAS